MKDNIMDKIRFPRSVKNSELINSQVEELNNAMEEQDAEPKVWSKICWSYNCFCDYNLIHFETFKDSF